MYEGLKTKFEERFGRPAAYIFGAPGRTELGGNHTDHQHGIVLAGAVDRETLAAVAPKDWNCKLKGGCSSVATVYSEGYGEFSVDLEDLEPRESEYGTPLSLIRGVAAQFAEKGWLCPGFEAYIVSDVPGGSGLSSSAAFEVLIGNIINVLSGAAGIDVWQWRKDPEQEGAASSASQDPADCSVKFKGWSLKEAGSESSFSPQDIAIMGQKAENVFFGKPCGLMDQMASSIGSVVSIDFADPDAPKVEPISFDFAGSGYKLCIVNCGADHADLTDEYASITEELAKVCGVFGKTHLRDIPEAEFDARIAEVRRAAGDRAALRAMHVYTENKRARRMADALKKGDFERFLELSGWSGISSWTLMQNVIPCGASEHQDLAFAYAYASKLLKGKGACRVHGGGFAGTIQAFVPNDMAEAFCRSMDEVLGEGSAELMNINLLGGGLREIIS
jgi:galactokinase